MAHVFRKLVGGLKAFPIERTYVEEPILTLPASTDLRHFYGPICNQGQLGSCTAFAALQWFSALRVQSGYPWVEYSELAQYYEERVLQNTVNEDSGATTEEALTVLETFGPMAETRDPYNIANFRNPPPSDWLSHIKLLDKQARWISRNPDGKLIPPIKNALAHNHPIVFGFICFDTLESREAAMTGLVVRPVSINPIGGHDCNIVGYDDHKVVGPDVGACLIRNQWDEGWGDHGYFWLSYEYLEAYLDGGACVGFPLEDGVK